MNHHKNSAVAFPKIYSVPSNSMMPSLKEHFHLFFVRATFSNWPRTKFEVTGSAHDSIDPFARKRFHIPWSLSSLSELTHPSSWRVRPSIPSGSRCKKQCLKNSSVEVAELYTFRLKPMKPCIRMWWKIACMNETFGYLFSGIFGVTCTLKRCSLVLRIAVR